MVLYVSLIIKMLSIYYRFLNECYWPVFWPFVIWVTILWFNNFRNSIENHSCKYKTISGPSKGPEGILRLSFKTCGSQYVYGNESHTNDKSKRRRASMACVLRFPFLKWEMNSDVKLQNFPIFQYKQHEKSIKYQQIVGTIPNLLLFITFRIVVDFFVPHLYHVRYKLLIIK